MRRLPAALAAIALAGAARADPVRFDWTGTVSYADPSLASAGIVAGAPAEGHYRFESATPDDDPDPQIGSYDAPLLEWRVAVGLVDNTTTEPGFGAITIRLDVPGTGDVLRVDVGPSILLRLQDLDGTALTSDALPTTPPDLADLEAAGLAQLDPGTGETLVAIGFDTLTPGPPAIPLLPSWGPPLVALLSLAAGRRGASRPRRVAPDPDEGQRSPTREEVLGGRATAEGRAAGRAPS